MGAGIIVDTVSRRYGTHDVLALDRVSTRIVAGEFIALMGPSGCGKSTLLNLIGAIDRASEGRILIGDTDLGALDEAGLTHLRRTRLGFIFQFFNLLSTLSVFENVALPLELTRNIPEKTRKQQVEAMLHQVGMTPRQNFYPAQLSGGEMQRVAIARALVHRPDVILADEPTGNLDTENGAHILGLLSSLCRDNGQTVLMATHSHEAAACADRILHMRDGRLIDTPAKGAPT